MNNSPYHDLKRDIHEIYDDLTDSIMHPRSRMLSNDTDTTTASIPSLSGGLKTITTISSVNKTNHIALYNYNNSFCFHISVLQKLHTSPTLNLVMSHVYRQQLNQFFLAAESTNRYIKSVQDLPDMLSIESFKRSVVQLIPNEPLQHTILTQFLYPVYLYSVWDYLQSTPTLHAYIDANRLNKCQKCPLFTDFSLKISDFDLYTRMKQYFDAFVPNFVKQSARNGYYPQQLLIYYMLPCVHAFTNAFERSQSNTTSEPIFFLNILSELHIERINFKQIEYVYADEITGESSYLDDVNYRNTVYTLYSQMMKNIPESYDMQPFVAATLEVFPNKDKTGGHAITLIKCRDTCSGTDQCEYTDCYYIIDDHNCISTLEDYYSNRSARLYEIVIREIDPVNIANINRILRSRCSSDTSFSNRVTRYVLNFEHKFLTGADIIAERASKLIESTREQVLERIDERFNKIVGGNDKSQSFIGYMSDKWIVFIFGILVGIVIMCAIVKRVCSRLDSVNNQRQFHRESFISRAVRRYIINDYPLNVPDNTVHQV